MIVPESCDQTAPGFDEAFNAAQSTRWTALRQLDKETLDVMLGVGKKKPLAIPSNAFLTNNTDRLLSKSELLVAMGVKSGTPDFDIGNEVLRKIGIRDAVLFAEKEVRDITQSLKLVDNLVYSESNPIGARIGRPSKALKFTSDVGNFWRLMSTGYDWAASF